MMNYYDEEIAVNGPDTKNLRTMKIDRVSQPSLSGSAALRQFSDSRNTSIGRQRIVMHSNSTDDDGLLQDILDHDDDGDDDDDDDVDSEPRMLAPRKSATQRLTSTRMLNLPTAKALENDSEGSDTESEEDAAFSGLLAKKRISASKTKREITLSITPEEWEKLTVHQEVKDLFPFILKYTPQSIDTPYHLQPFIPEYVPAVGDVDAFLKVLVPPLPEKSSAAAAAGQSASTSAAAQQQRQQDINEHLCKLGLYFLDEPSGEQSEPSLLNMKLRSVLSGSGVRGTRSTFSASLVPIAKSPKDLDKWINEIEQVHMSQSIHDAQPRKDIEPLLIDWPRSYADSTTLTAIQDTYQRCLQDDITLVEYIKVLCQRFHMDAPSETQADYILNVYTLFALYLAANQAWE